MSEPAPTYEQPGAANERPGPESLEEPGAAVAEPAPAPAWTVLDGLTPAPRRVPAAYAAAGLSFSIAEWWTVFMIAVAPIALWLAVHQAIPVALLLVIVLGLRLRIRGLLPRLAMLRWGDPTRDGGPGVALADSRDRSRVRPLSDFPYVLAPGRDGNFTGRLDTGTWIGIGFTTLLYVAMLTGAVTTLHLLW